MNDVSQNLGCSFEGEDLAGLFGLKVKEISSITVLTKHVLVLGVFV